MSVESTPDKTAYHTGDLSEATGFGLGNQVTTESMVRSTPALGEEGSRLWGHHELPDTPVGQREDLDAAPAPAPGVWEEQRVSKVTQTAHRSLQPLCPSS